MSVRSYRDLDVWRLGIELVEEIYMVTRALPKSELYGLTSQMQRAAVSVPSNVAEGQQRESTKEFLHHVSYSLGSLAELNTLLAICERLSYSDSVRISALSAKTESIGKMLRSLQRSLRAKL
ncbi:MAG TPA: four helix bundle protein [Pirellulales bacterium]|nr:four helix bundle protein [Pirellulales bacterium]